MEAVDFPPEFPAERVLDEIAGAGFAGTELGPFGFLPTNPDALRAALASRRLTLCSAFVAFPLGKRAARAEGLMHVDRTAALIRQVGSGLLILSDEVSGERSAIAGNAEEANRRSWTEEEWKEAKESIEQVIGRCQPQGLKVAFHHHVGTHVETPQEMRRLFSLFPPDALGLCLDTGHCVYGGGDPLEMTKQYGDRLLCLHLKDVHAEQLNKARAAHLDFHGAVRHGVFAPLGEGTVNLGGLLSFLRDFGFDGWVVVEQDVLAGGQDAHSPWANAVASRQTLRRLGY
jgi:inosose dehydratase